MRRMYAIVGVGALSACLAGWAALAWAQTGPVPSMPLTPEEVQPTSRPGTTGLQLPPPPASTGFPAAIPLSAQQPSTSLMPMSTPVQPTPMGTVGPAPMLPAPINASTTAPIQPTPISSPTAAPIQPAPINAPTAAPIGLVQPTTPPTTFGSGSQPPMVAPPVNQPLPEDKVELSQTEANPTGRQEPAISMEWIGPPTAKVGQPCDYVLVIRNACTIPVQQVLVRVRMPAGVTVAASEPKAQADGNVLVWELGTLLAKQEKNLQVRMVAEARGDVMPQAWVTFTGSAVMRLKVREPKLVLKTTAPEKVLVGNVAAFTMTVTNPGDGAAEKVNIKAVLSEGLDRPAKVDFDIGSLAAGETRSVQVICGAKSGGMQKCEGEATAEGVPATKDAASVNVITPRLDVKVTGPALRYLDKKALYTLYVTNPGDAPATNVTVADVVPDGFKVLAASDGGRHDFSTRTVSWFLGEVLPGQTREVKLEVQCINIGAHKHKATTMGQPGLHAESEMVTKVEGVSALLLEMVDTEDPIEVGGDTSYEIRVTNTGSKTETDIRLVAEVPDKMEFKSLQGPARFHAEGKKIIVDPIDKLAPHADALFRINVKATEAGSVRFKLQMTSTNLTEPIIKMEGTRIYDDKPEGAAPAPPVTPVGAPALPTGGQVLPQ